MFCSFVPSVVSVIIVIRYSIYCIFLPFFFNQNDNINDYNYDTNNINEYKNINDGDDTTK